MEVLGRRIHCTKQNFARVEVNFGNSLQDAEWVPITNFMDYGICKQVLDLLVGLEESNDVLRQ